MKWIPETQKEELTELLLEDRRELYIEVDVAYQSHLGITCAYIRRPNEQVITQEWAHDFSTTNQRPIYLSEAPLAHLGCSDA